MNMLGLLFHRCETRAQEATSTATFRCPKKHTGCFRDLEKCPRGMNFSGVANDLVHVSRHRPGEMPPGLTPGLWEAPKESLALGSPGFALRALGRDLHQGISIKADSK